MVKRLEMLHQHGFTHNDVKPQNIMVHDDKVVLIDFGASDVMPGRDQKRPKRVLKYKGSPSFSSLEHLYFYETCARDDMVSLFHMLFYLLCENKFVTKEGYVFSEFKDYRVNHNLTDLVILLIDNMELFEKDDEKVPSSHLEKLYECEEKFFSTLYKIAE